MIKSNKKPLIIWDFDGVMADSERLWIEVWRNLLKKEKNIVLTKEEELKLLVGAADRTKKHNLQSYFPNVTFDADFMQKITEGEIYMGRNFMKPMPGLEQILSDSHFEHCIATGGTKEQHGWKMSILPEINSYIKEEDCFTVDMVKHGKPAPDLFLLVLQKKGYKANQAVVIEDSLNGIQAAKGASVPCIAFVGAEGNNTPDYKKQCLEAGALTVCQNMMELHNTLKKLFI